MKILIINNLNSKAKALADVLMESMHFTDILSIDNKNGLLALGTTYKEIAAIITADTGSSHENEQILQTLNKLFPKAFIFFLSKTPLLGFENVTWLNETQITVKLTHTILGALANSGQLPPEHAVNVQTHKQLSPRLQEIFELIAKGYGNKEIAEMLGISAGTVNVHSGTIRKFLGVSNRTQVALAYRKLFEIKAKPAA